MGRFTNLVDTPKGIENFKARYHIPAGVSIWHCLQGEWHAMRSEGGGSNPHDRFHKGRGDEDPYG